MEKFANKFLEYCKGNVLEILCILIWVLITFPSMLNHAPWFDEAHAWTIAKYINLTNWFEIAKVEGHTIIWWLLLKPFAKNDIAYPYSMSIINWIFCFLSVLVLQFKSPFNKLTKFIVIFSTMYINYFSYTARCYSVGLFALFLLMSVYSKRFQKPILFSFILIFALNTSIMAAVGALAITVLYMYDIFRNKINTKNVLLSCGIIVIGYSLLILPLIGADSSAYNPMVVSINHVRASFRNHIYCAAFLIVVMYLNFFKKNISGKVFYIVVFYALTIIFTFIYGGAFYHKFFYVIYLLIALWMLDCDKKNVAYPVIIYFSLLILFNPKVPKYKDNLSPIIATSINKIASYNSVIITKRSINTLIPYLRKDLLIYDYCSQKKLTWQYVKIDNVDTCVQKNYQQIENINIDNLIQKQTGPVYIFDSSLTKVK